VSFIKSKKKIAKVFPQIIILIFLLVVQVLSLLNLIPSTVVLGGSVVDLFDKHGLPMIATCSLIENIVGINVYFPGALPVLVGMSLSAGNPNLAMLTYFSIVCPAFLGNVASYYVGRFSGSTNDKQLNSVSKRMFGFYLATYWHPHLASITAFREGANGTRFRVFIGAAILASMPWSIFWALLLYNVGAVGDKPAAVMFITYAYVIVWLCWDLAKRK